jgi:hypothetical protein
MMQHEIRDQLADVLGCEIDKQIHAAEAQVIMPINSIQDFEDVDLEGCGLLVTLNDGTTFELEIRQQQ